MFNIVVLKGQLYIQYCGVRGAAVYSIVCVCLQMKPLHTVDFTFRLTIFLISSAFLVVSGLLEVSTLHTSLLIVTRGPDSSLVMCWACCPAWHASHFTVDSNTGPR